MSTIEVAITGDEEYGRYIKALICGDPGSGKTLISSTFPNVLYASAEGGLMSIARRKLPYVKITASEQLLALKNAMEQDAEVRAKLLGLDKRGLTRVDTIVIDTIDEMGRILVKERLEQTRKDTFQIADWGWLGDQMRGIVRAFRNLDMHVVFTCHLKQTEDGETGRQYFKPALQGAMGDEIAGYVDLALLLRTQNVTRVVDGESRRVMLRQLVTVPDPSFPWIKDRSGALPPEIPVNFDNDFTILNDLIFGGLDDDVIAPTETFSSEPLLETIEAEVATPVEAVLPMPAPVPPLGDRIAAPEGVDADTGEVTVSDEEMEKIRNMPVTEKMTLVPPFHCEECRKPFSNEDQRDLSCIKLRQILCTSCYKSK